MTDEDFNIYDLSVDDFLSYASEINSRIENEIFFRDDFKEQYKFCVEVCRFDHFNEVIKLLKHAIAECEDGLNHLTDQKRSIISVFQSLSNPDHGELLIKRYLEGKQWDEIAREMTYTIPGIKSKNKSAIKALDAKLDEIRGSNDNR